MSYLLAKPRAVLVVAADEALVDHVRDVLADAAVTSVRGAASVEAAREVLDDASDIGCVVGTDDVESGVVELCRAIRNHDPRLPVVTYVADGGEQLAADVTAAGAYAYVPRSDGDRLAEVVPTATEVYDRRRRHYERNSMFETLLTGQDAAIYVKDEHARHILKGSTAGDLKREMFVGKTDVDVYGEQEHTLDSLSDDMRVIEDRDTIDGKVTSYEAPDGTHWSETTKMPWVDDGEVKGLIGVTRDITETVETRNRLENHRERLEEFTEYVTHDLRNPLQVASGAIELAKETGDDQQLDRAARAVERAGEILDDFREHIDEQMAAGTAIERGADDDPIPDAVFITDVVEDVWRLLGDDGGTLDCLFDDDARITASKSSVRPVFENLLSNAVRHGGESVTVRIGPIDSGGFYVADDGPGIPPEERERVLEKGYTTASEGTGTGLELVAAIADREEWRLNITESADGGARIELRNCPVVATPDLDALAGGPVTVGEELPVEDETSVGPVSVEGDAGYDAEAGRWFVAGSGRNLWLDTNEFHFLYTSVDGPCRIQGRVTDVENVTEYSLAAFLVRQSLDEDAAYGGIGQTTEHGTNLVCRPERGGDGAGTLFENGPIDDPWYRVVRIDDTVTTFLSADGEEWHPIDQRRIELGDTAYVGIGVCSNRPGQLCAATFEDLTVNRLVVG